MSALVIVRVAGRMRISRSSERDVGCIWNGLIEVGRVVLVVGTELN